MYILYLCTHINTSWILHATCKALSNRFLTTFWVLDTPEITSQASPVPWVLDMLGAQLVQSLAACFQETAWVEKSVPSLHTAEKNLFFLYGSRGHFIEVQRTPC